MILIFLFLFYSSQGSTTAIPLVGTPKDILAHNTSLSPVETPACTCPDQRSIWDIIWSCLVTVFACTWVSVHPNIPDPNEKWWMVTLRRVELVVWTLLTPELIIMWAFRQWLSARYIAEEQKGKGWEKTHGYFMQMGGFMLCDGDQRMGTLSYTRFKELLAKDRIEFPAVTQEDIKDRSKSDGLSKLLVIGQTGWFILQCITRRIQKLPITELELATLAFATLNGCMYFFWWNKPFDVRAPVRVNLQREKSQDPSVETNYGKVDGHMSSEGNEVDLGSEESSLVSKGGCLNASEERLPDQQITWFQVITGPWMLLKMIGGRLYAMASLGSDDFVEFNDPTRPEAEIGPMQVPTFYSFATTDDYWTLLPTCVIGSMFGAIHCAGWFFHFPTVAELWIWRISSLHIAVYPILPMVIVGIFDKLDDSKSPIFRAFSNILAILFVFGLFLYIIARFLLLAECLTTLRDLPPGAYDVVQWTIRIPHI